MRRMNAVALVVLGSWIEVLFFTPRLVAQPDEATTKSAELSIDGAILKTIETTSTAAQVSGVIETLGIKEGSRVKVGQELGRIRDKGIQLQSERAKAAVQVAKKKQANDIDRRLAAKNRSVAENEYQRAVEANLQVKDVYPINEIDRLRLLFDRTTLETERAAHLQDMASLELSIAEIEYRQSLELLERHRITAPCDGVIVAVEKRVGEWVEPGSVLVKIVQIDRLRIEGFINAEDAVADLVGSKAHVEVQSGASLLETQAEFVFISPDANPLNSQVRVFLEVDNRDGRLRPGMRPKTNFKRVVPK